MRTKQKAIPRTTLLRIATTLLLLMISVVSSYATIDGVSGTTFNFTARTDRITTGDGGSVLFWGYALDAGRAQYPGPTLIVNEGDTITINLTNMLRVKGGVPNVSLVFPGQEGVTATGGVQGLLTRESPINSTTTYTFTAAQPGTYYYHSGTQQDLQVEMGLVGAIIVRPAGFNINAPTAYNHADSAYDREYLFLLSEMDPRIHLAIQSKGIAAVNPTWYSDYFSGWWFINGRNAPDTMLLANEPTLPTQPYNIFPQMHPGERVLMRVIGGGREAHPFHHHGNHARTIAKDGRLLDSGNGAAMIDLSYMEFTISAVPGETTDAIFEWTSQGLGWDIYGDPTDPMFAHTCNGLTAPSDIIDPATGEDCNYHGTPIPVTLPENQSLTFGGFWSGSPYMGSLGSLPPGEGGLNPNGGLSFMWHSHTEKELTNYDIFPGGMMTMVIIEPPGAIID